MADLDEVVNKVVRRFQLGPDFARHLVEFVLREAASTRMTYTKEQQDAILGDYRAGMKLEIISLIYGCSTSYPRYLARVAGDVARPTNGPGGRGGRHDDVHGPVSVQHSVGAGRYRLDPGAAPPLS